MDSVLIPFGAAVLGAVAGFLANRSLARHDRRLSARQKIYYELVNSIYDCVWKARGRAKRGLHISRRTIDRIESVTRLIEMESRRSGSNDDLTAAQELHTAMRVIWSAPRQLGASADAWDAVAQAILRLNAGIGRRLNN